MQDNVFELEKIFQMINRVRRQSDTQKSTTTEKFAWQHLSLQSDEPAEIEIQEQKTFHHSEQGWGWFKNLNIPPIKVCVRIANQEYPLRKMSAHIFAVRQQTEDHELVQAELYGTTVQTLKDGECVFQGLKFSQTSFMYKCCKFFLIVLVTKHCGSEDSGSADFERITGEAIISPELYIESRKKTCYDGSQFSHFDPFLPENIDKQLVKITNSSNKSIIVTDDLHGLFSYYTTPRIRHKSPGFFHKMQQEIYNALISSSLNGGEDVNESSAPCDTRPLYLCLNIEHESNETQVQIEKISKFLKGLEGPALAFSKTVPSYMPKQFTEIKYNEKLRSLYKNSYSELCGLKLNLSNGEGSMVSQYQGSRAAAAAMSASEGGMGSLKRLCKGSNQLQCEEKIAHSLDDSSGCFATFSAPQPPQPQPLSNDYLKQFFHSSTPNILKGVKQFHSAYIDMNKFESKEGLFCVRTEYGAAARNANSSPRSQSISPLAINGVSRQATNGTQENSNNAQVEVLSNARQLKRKAVQNLPMYSENDEQLKIEEEKNPNSSADSNQQQTKASTQQRSSSFSSSCQKAGSGSSGDGSGVAGRSHPLSSSSEYEAGRATQQAALAQQLQKHAFQQQIFNNAQQLLQIQNQLQQTIQYELLLAINNLIGKQVPGQATLQNTSENVLQQLPSELLLNQNIQQQLEQNKSNLQEHQKLTIQQQKQTNQNDTQIN